VDVQTDLDRSILRLSTTSQLPRLTYLVFEKLILQSFIPGITPGPFEKFRILCVILGDGFNLVVIFGADQGG
jgi:hypothetical protein